MIRPDPRLDQIREDNDGQLPAYAWPGGYPIVYYTKDGLTICPECANREIDQMQEVVASDIYYEGPPLVCDDCERTTIESAYGDPAEETDQEVDP